MIHRFSWNITWAQLENTKRKDEEVWTVFVILYDSTDLLIQDLDYLIMNQRFLLRSWYVGDKWKGWWLLGGCVWWNQENQRELERPAKREFASLLPVIFSSSFFSPLFSSPSLFSFPYSCILSFLDLLPPSRTFYLFLHLSFVAKSNQLTNMCIIYKTYLEIVGHNFISLFFLSFSFSSNQGRSPYKEIYLTMEYLLMSFNMVPWHTHLYEEHYFTPFGGNLKIWFSYILLCI